MAMSSYNKLSRKGSFEDFYYTEIVDSSKSSASTILSMQFAQMRENLANAGFKPASEVVNAIPGSAGKGVKFDAATISLSESPLRVPAARVARSHVPSHVVPKRPAHEAPVLLLSPAKTPAKYVNSKALSRQSSPSPDKVKAKRSPSPAPIKDMGVNPVYSLPEHPEIVRTLGTLASTSREEDGSFGTVNTFRGLKRVNSGTFQEEVHLHHDVFLATQDDSIAQAVHSMSRRSQEVVSRYADTPEVNYNLKPVINDVKCVVPSHVVAPRSAERARSAPRGSSMSGGESFVSKKDALEKKAALLVATNNFVNTSGGTSPTAEKTAPGDNAPVTTSRLTAKNLALNLSLYPAASTSKSNLLELRVSPTTVSASPQNSSLAASSPGKPVIKSPQKKKAFDFASAPAAPVVPSAGAVATAHGTTIAKAGHSSSLTKIASQPNVQHGMETRRRGSLHQMSEIYTPLKDPSKPAHAPLTAHATPNTTSTAFADKLATPSPVKIYSPGTTLVAPYRTLTAAEHAAAATLSAKINAANAAYHREETVVVPPLRTMSRALSQLVYNVRDK